MSSETTPPILLIVRNVAALWLVFVLAYALGMVTLAWNWWPYEPLRELWHFVRGDGTEETTVTERLKNDFGMKPARHIVASQRQFKIPDHYRELEGLDLRDRRLAPLVHLSDAAQEGYRLLHGSFDFNGGLHGALLLGPDGEVLNQWVVGQQDTPWANREDANVFPHGMDVLPDGDIIVAFDSGSSLIRYDYCGDIVWRTKGVFHHSVTLEGDRSVWVWGNPQGQLNQGEHMVEVDAETGEVLRSIYLDEVLPANPEIDPFAIRQDDQADGSLWLFDRFHVNDVDPLPAELADRYESFEAGDLLISLRSINLVAVVDPDDLKVKWWRQGLVRRQHDPDWNERGTITIYDNNMHRDYSRIQEIDPITYEAKVVVPGEPYEFYSWRRGKHQPLRDGGFSITSTEQGRVFELDNEGNIVFEFINRFGEKGEYLVVSEAKFLPMDYFKELPQCEG